MKRFIPLLLAALCGLGGVAAFAPFNLAPLAVLSLTGLFGLWARHGRTRRSAAGIGFAFGVAHFLGGVHWIFVSLSVYGGMPPPLAAFGTLLFACYLALFPMLVGLLLAWRPWSDRRRWLVLAPLAWVLAEWARGTLLTGFPWLTFGFAHSDTPLAGFAPLLGVYGMTALNALLAGLLVWTMRQHSRPGWLKAGAAAVAVLLVGQGLRGVEWTAPGKPVTVSLLQGNIPQDIKWNPDYAAQSLDTYVRLLDRSHGALRILPETALPMFWHQVPPELHRALAARAQADGARVLLGIPEWRGNEIYHNSALLLDDPHQVYRKEHLVPFGEFLPMRPVMRWLLDILHIPLADFTAGAPNQPLIDVAGQRVAVDICYEDLFGAEIAARAGSATLLVNQSNLAWFGDSIALPQHLQIARLRALETGKPMLRATNTGVTAAIDADGRVLGMLPLFQADVLEVSLQGRTGQTPYTRWRDQWLWGLLPLLLIVMGWRKRPV